MTSTANGEGGEVGQKASPSLSRLGVSARTKRLVSAIRTSDDAPVEGWPLEVSRSRRWLAPLAFAVSAFTAVVAASKLLFSNWRLTLVQLLPAMWVWATMLDLKLRAFQGKSVHVERGLVRIPIVVAIAAATAAAFFLNAVFAFAVARSSPPKIPPAFGEARSHLRLL